MVCRVNGLAYCLSRISTWQGASPYGVPLGRPVGLLTAAGNSSSSIKAETNGSDNDGSKHVDVAAHYVRERMRSGDISYHYVSTTENIADCLSKNNYYPAFKKFRAAMGVA